MSVEKHGDGEARTMLTLKRSLEGKLPRYSTSVIERLTSQGKVVPWQVIEVLVGLTDPSKTLCRSKPDDPVSIATTSGKVRKMVRVGICGIPFPSLNN